MIVKDCLQFMYALGTRVPESFTARLQRAYLDLKLFICLRSFLLFSQLNWGI